MPHEIKGQGIYAYVTPVAGIEGDDELRADLRSRGHVFRGRSDNEVILHLYAEYGAACVDHLVGMFAFAIWDVRERTLFLARDRIEYAVLGGAIINRLLVKRDVEKIFSYRHHRLKEIFPPPDVE
jgi:glutamine phosphoribosylpyrophosphate amidotransferase